MSATISTCSSVTPVGNRVRRRVGERHPHELGLRAVDQVAEDPTATTDAQPVVTFAAEPARAARRDARHEHAVAGLHVLHAGADRFDRADRFVAEDAPVGDLGNVTLEDVQIGAADRDGVDANNGIGIGARSSGRRRLPTPSGRDRGTRVPSSTSPWFEWSTAAAERRAFIVRRTPPRPLGPSVTPG